MVVDSRHLENFLQRFPYLSRPSRSIHFSSYKAVRLFPFLALPSGVLSPVQHISLWKGVDNAWLFWMSILARPSACSSWTIKLLESLALVEICLVSHQLTSSGFWSVVLRQPCLSESFGVLCSYKMRQRVWGFLAQIGQGVTAGGALSWASGICPCL